MQRIFIQGVKGGVGTTAITANLAHSLNLAEERVLCVDLGDDNDLKLYFGVPWQESAGWHLQQDWFANVFESEDGEHVLPFGEQVPTHTESYLSAVNDIINHPELLNSRKAEWLLFDVPHYVNLNALTLQNDDIVIVVAQANFSAIGAIQKKYRLLNELACKHTILINKYDATVATEENVYRMMQAQYPQLAPCFLHYDAAVNESLGFYNVVANCAPKSQFVEDLDVFAAWLINLGNKLRHAG